MEQHTLLTTLNILVVVFFIFAISILVIIAQWRIYEKAGQPGWASLIPFYNFYVLLKIVGKPEWWLIWIFVPLANLIVGIWTTNLLSKSFGKDEAFTLGLIILPVIFYPILGFGNAEYQGPAGKPKVTEIDV
jgi:hypothetical protein